MMSRRQRVTTPKLCTSIMLRRSKKGVYLFRLFSKNFLEMLNMDSKFNWFINKFSLASTRLRSDKNGFTIASEFHRTGDKTIKNSQYRQLMKLAADRHHATDNGMSSSHSKYAIRFKFLPVETRLFDKELLKDNLFFYNLVTEIILSQNPSLIEFIAPDGDWERHTLYWMSILQTFNIYEDTGEIETDILSKLFGQVTLCLDDKKVGIYI